MEKAVRQTYDALKANPYLQSDTWREGTATGLDALAYEATFHRLGGKRRNQPGWETSKYLSDVGIVSASLATGGLAEAANAGIELAALRLGLPTALNAFGRSGASQMAARLILKHVIGGGLGSVAASLLINHFWGRTKYTTENFRDDVIQGIEFNGIYSGWSAGTAKITSPALLAQITKKIVKVTSPTLIAKIAKKIVKEFQLYHHTFKSNREAGTWTTIFDDVSGWKEILIGGLRTYLRPNDIKNLAAFTELDEVPLTGGKLLTGVKDVSKKITIAGEDLNDYVISTQRSSGSLWKAILGQYVKKGFNAEELEMKYIKSAIGRNAWQSFFGRSALGQSKSASEPTSPVMQEQHNKNVIPSLPAQIKNTMISNNKSSTPVINKANLLPQGVSFVTSNQSPLPASRLSEGIYYIMQKSDFLALKKEIAEYVIEIITDEMIHTARFSNSF
jgi:hypothetical protein